MMELVIYAELENGKFERAEMKLIEKFQYEGKEIMVYETEEFERFVTYNHNEKINWKFMEEIQEKFQ